MQILLIALMNGILFGSGLALSGMTDPNKVIGFLDIAGNWDITLMFVMMGGLTITLPGFQYILKHKSAPTFTPEFSLPKKNEVDKSLIIGALLFGAGWSLVGLCPGPAIASISYLRVDVIIYILFLVIGLFIGDRIPKS